MTPSPTLVRSLPRPRGASFAAAALGAALAVGSAAPAEAIKLWERDGKKRSTQGAPGVQAGPGEAAAPVVGTGLAAEAAAAFGVSLPSTGAPPLAEFVVRGDHHRALAPYEEAMPADGASASQHLAYANALTRRGYPEAAAAEYLEALDLEPGLQPAWVNLGVLARRAERWDVAERLLRHAIDLVPRDGLAWYQLAMVKHAVGDLPEADAAYLQALELDPGLWSPSVNPHVLQNERWAVILHARYMNRSADAAPLAGGALGN